MRDDPKFHLPEQGLVEYATGIGSQAAGLAADCHLGFCGRCRGELAASREGLSLTHRHDQRYLEAELWRVDGELAYRRGESDAAAALRRAVEVAEGQGASWLERRARRSLASRYPDSR